MPPEKENQKSETYKSSIKPIRTYSSDIAETVQTQKESIVSISLKEQEKKRTERKELVEHAGRSALVTVSLFLFAGGLVALFAYWFVSMERTPETVNIIDTIIVADREISIDASSRESILSEVNRAKGGETLAAGEILHLKTGLDTESFIRNIGGGASASLIRALEETFMLGIIHTETNEPFLVFKVISFDHAFPGMLAWEPLLPEKLGVLFTETLPTGANFLDVIVRNKDTRSYTQGANTEPAFLYSFLDSNTLVITSSVAAFQELVNAHTSSQLLR